MNKEPASLPAGQRGTHAPLRPHCHARCCPRRGPAALRAPQRSPACAAACAARPARPAHRGLTIRPPPHLVHQLCGAAEKMFFGSGEGRRAATGGLRGPVLRLKTGLNSERASDERASKQASVWGGWRQGRQRRGRRPLLSSRWARSREQGAGSSAAPARPAACPPSSPRGPAARKCFPPAPAHLPPCSTPSLGAGSHCPPRRP